MSKKPMKDMVKWVKDAAAPSTLRKKSSGASYAASPNRPSNKQWVHPPDVINHGRVEYAVRFLGDVQVPEAKGTEVIKDAIHKIRFQLQVRRSHAGNSGSKLPKVVLTINVDGVTISDSKSRLTLHKYPLHRISFCADDKADKRLFSFIAKGPDSPEGKPSHRCFVFLSERLAEEITLTIGEAFDLAYRKFLDKNGRDLETKKELLVLRRRVGELEKENAHLRTLVPPHLLPASSPSLPSTSGMGNPKGSWTNFGQAPVPPVAVNRPPPPGIPLPPLPTGASSNSRILQDLGANGPTVGAKLENLAMEDMENIFDDDFNPRAGEPKAQTNGDGPKDPFGLNPFLEDKGVKRQESVERRVEEPTAAEMEAAIAQIDSRLAEMLEGFESGLSLGQDADLNSGDPFGDLSELDFTAQPSTTPSKP